MQYRMRRRLRRPRRRGRSQAARDRAAAEARRDQARPTSLRELETLSVMWRGDGDRGEDAADAGADLFRDRALCRSLRGRADRDPAAAQFAEVSRQAQDAASALFAQLFLSPKGDDLPPVDALGMFYEYRELTPIGRRGDEMIRRLADRLVGGRSARSGQPNCCSTRSTSGWRARRARRSPRGSPWSI